MKNIINTFLFILFGVSGAFAQFDLTGVVVDVRGEPIPGVYVQVEGNNKNGTTTNFEGEFTFSDVEENMVLVFSYTGFQTRKIKVADENQLNVTLLESTSKLDEVVVIGYGTSTKKDLTGSVSSMDPEKLTKTTVSNFDQALAGRMSGVRVSSSDGTPGSSMNIVIRGTNSITGDNSPLFVVDGVPLDDFDPSTLSTGDIKTLDVLKDASATAIYGSRAANGVVVITTKQGRTDGKTDIEISGRYGFSKIPTRLEVLGPYEYVKYQQQIALSKDGGAPGSYARFFQNTWVDPELYKGVKGKSWQDEIFRTSRSEQYKATISGGDRKTNIRYSAEYNNEEGTLINTGFKKLINQLNFRHRKSDKTQFNGYLQYTHIDQYGLNVRGNSYNAIIRDAINFRPVEPLISDGLGEGGYDPFDDATKYIYNPIKTLNNTERKTKRDVVRGTLGFTQRILPGLTFRSTGTYQVNQTEQTVFFGEETQQAKRGPDGINAEISKYRVETLSNANTLTFNQQINEHKFEALGGVEFNYRKLNRLEASNGHIPTELFGMDNIGLGTTPGIPKTLLSKSSLMSYFVRGNYSLADKYRLTATFRADGSSKFQKSNRWGYFPSFSAAWDFDKEDWLVKSENLSFGKLRLGWGRTGNNRIGDYEAYSQLSTNDGSGYVWGAGNDYKPGAVMSNLGVPDLKWETTEQFNIGLDLGFFDNRIEFTADLYQKVTHDLLLNAEMALHTGFSNVQQNIGKVENKGLELTLKTINVDSEEFRWESDFNISFERNKTKALNRNQEAIYTNPNFDFKYAEYAYITKVGKPVGMIYGLEYDGLYQQDDFTYDNKTGAYELKEGIPDNGAAVGPGGVKFKDKNGDGTIDNDDRTIIGDPHPDFYGGFSNTFLYKNFDLNFLFEWSYGFDILNANKAVFETPDTKRFNALSGVGDAWTKYHTETDINTISYNNMFGVAPDGNQIDDRYIEDGSYLKFKSISLGYTFPKNIIDNLGLTNLRIELIANNLYTWTKYSGFDPEVSVGRYGALTPHLDYSSYPQSRTFMLGLDVVF